MSPMAERWIEVGFVADVPRRGARCVKVPGYTVAIFRTGDDQIFALEDKCPHKGGPLSQGIVHDGCVTCPLHNWVIGLADGKAQGADEGAAKTIPVKVDGGHIMIDIGILAVKAA